MLDFVRVEGSKIGENGIWCRTRVYRVMRMRLSTAKRAESPATLLEQLRRIHQQTVQTADGRTLTGLTEMTPAQKSLFAALELALPTPENLIKPAL